MTLKGISDKDWVLNGIQVEMCTGVLVIGCLILFLAGGHQRPLFFQHVNTARFWSMASVVCKTQGYLAGERLTLINENRGWKTPGEISVFPLPFCLKKEEININQNIKRVLLYIPPFSGDC